MKHLRVSIFRYLSKNGKMVSFWEIEEREFYFLFNLWTPLYHHGFKSFPSRKEAEEYIRLYKAVCRNWRKISR